MHTDSLDVHQPAGPNEEGMASEENNARAVSPVTINDSEGASCVPCQRDIASVLCGNVSLAFLFTLSLGVTATGGHAHWLS